MTSQIVREQSASFIKPRPNLRAGYTVRVHERVQEGGKERIQVFEGLIISVHKGMNPTDTTFTVRRIASGVGVERIFSLHAPSLEKIEVKKVAKVRRAKLFFLRGRRGKAARLSERFTTAEEFAVAAAPDPKPQEKEQEQETEAEAEQPAEQEAPMVEDTKESKQEESAASQQPESQAQEAPEDVLEEPAATTEGEAEKKEEA